MKRTARFISITTLFLASVQLQALTYNWTNGNANNIWNQAGNWDVGGTYPGQTANDVANIAAGGTPQITAGTITIDNLNLVGTVTNSSGNLFTVVVAADIDGSISGGAGGMSLAAVTLSGNSTISAAGPITITGAVNGDFNLGIDSGAGLLTLVGSTFGPLINNLSLATTLNPAPLIPAINIDGNLSINFPGDPTVWNELGVTIDVTNNASITSLSAIGLNSTNAGTIILGSFTFNAVNVTLNEADATVLAGGTAGTNLTVSSLGVGGDITQTAALTIGNATSLTVPGGQDITLNNGGNNFGADVTFNSGGIIDDIRITDNSNFNVQAGLSMTDDLFITTSGASTFRGAFSTAGGGDIVLDSDGSVTQAGAITGANLLLRGTGSYTLDDAGNDVNTVAADNVSGVINFRDTDGFNVGTVQAITGIISSADVELTAGTAVGQIAGAVITAPRLLLQGTGPYELMEANDINTLAVNVIGDVDFRDTDGFALGTVQGVALATTGGDLVLRTDAGMVTQANPISATGLLLRGTGAFTLNNATNAITTIASDATGNIDYRDIAGVTVGIVTPQTGGAVNGITSGNANVTLTALAGALAVNQTVNTGTGNATLTTTGGNITQTASVVSSGISTLTVNTAGSDILFNGADNQLGTLVATGDEVHIRQRVAALDLGAIDAALFVLDSDQVVTQSGTIDDLSGTNGLYLTGIGPFTLDNAGNNVGTIAANVTGAMVYRDSNALIVGTVNAVNGITSTAEVTLWTGNTLSQTQTINTTTGLLLRGAGPFDLGVLGNTVTQIAANVTGYIDFNDVAAGGVDVDNVAGILGITTTDDAVTLTSVRPLGVNQAINTDVVVGDITLTVTGGGGTINLAAALIAGTGDIILNGASTVSQTAGTVSGAGLLLQGFGPYELMGANNINTLAIDVTNQVDFNDINGFVLNIVQGVALARSTADDIVLSSGGAVTQVNSLSATGLLLRGTGAFTLNNNFNAITTIASDAGGNIAYTDSNALSVGSVTPQTGGAVNGIVSGGGDVSLTTLNGALMVNQPVNTGAGNLTLTTTNGGITQGAGDTITSAGTATIDSDGGLDVITLNLAVNNFGTLILDGTTVEIQEFDNLILGNVNASLTFELDADGAVTQSGVTTVQTTDLLLLGTGSFALTNNNNAVQIAANVGGAVSFVDNTANLTVGTVTGTVGVTTINDTVILTAQAGNIAVGQIVDTDVGLGNIELTATGTIGVNAALTAGTGDIVLNGGGAVTQTVEVIGAGLLLEGAGPFTLTDVDNDVDTIAADSVSGFIDFIDADGFSVGTVQAIAGIITTTLNFDIVSLETVVGNISINDVLTTSASAISVTTPGNLAVNAAVSSVGGGIGDIDFTISGTVTIANTVSSGAGNLIIDADGAVTQTAVISGTGLRLLGDGPFDLSTQDNVFDDLAAAVTAGGTLAYNDANAINIANVGGTPGITTVAANIAVSTTAGAITVNQPVTSGSGSIGNVTLTAGGGGGTIDIDNTITTGNGILTLNSNGAVSQNAAFGLGLNTVSGLELLGAGPFNLNIAGGNDVDNLSANVTGNVDYVDQDALTITTVGATTGATLANNLLTLETINGSLTVAQAVNSGGGNIVLNVGTTGGGVLAVNSTMTSGAGDITATTTGNVTQTAGGTVTSTGITTITANAGAADIHLNLAPNALGTLTATGDEVRIRQGGIALVLANIDASIFTLDSNAAVTQSGGTAIDDGSGVNSALFTGAGPYTLTQAGNDIGTLAADVTGILGLTGYITYRDSNGFVVGSVTATLPPLTVNGVTATGAGRVVSLQAEALLDQTQPIVAPQLQLQGVGPFNLDALGTNDVDIIAADVTGQLDFEDTDDLTIGSVTNSAAVTVDGINTNGNLLDLVAGGFIRVDLPVTTGAGTGQILVFDAGGIIYLSETLPADSISTTHAAGFSLNDPIILEENSSLVSTIGSIVLGAFATVNDDGAGSDYTFFIDSGRDVSLGGDIGGTTAPVDVTIRAVGAGGATPAAGIDVTVSQDFIITAGTDYNMTTQSVTAGRDVSVAGTIDITGAATISATQDITGAGAVTVTGAAAVSASRDISINAVTVGEVALVATFNVGRNFTTTFTPGDNTDDSDADSTVIFNNTTAGGSGSANAFHNLTINDPGNIITSTGNWTVYGTLTLTDGTWDLDDGAGGAETHTIWGSWDSTLNAFAFDPTNSTVVFDGGTNATLRTDGIGTESFNNLVFDKSTGSTLALINVAGNTLEVTGNLIISDGRFSARTGATPGWNIQVTGNWTDTTVAAGDGFVHRNGEVIFVGGVSNVDPGTGISPYFYDLTITDSSIIHVNDAMTVANSLTVEAITIPAAMTSNAALTTSGSLVINAAAAAATLTMNAVFTANGAAAGSVTLQGGVNVPILDFTNQDFHFDGGNDTLDNTVGEIRLDGQQAIQDFPTVTAGSEALYGLVTLYDGGADGQIVASSHISGGTEAWFWNLTIDIPNRTITMFTDITVWGWSDPFMNGTLANNPGPVIPINLNGLRILRGTLNAELIPGTQYDIKLYGMMLTTNANTVGGWSYRWGTIGFELADPNGATVEFRGPYPAYVEGDNIFYRFVVNTGVDPRTAVPPQPSDPTVAGKNFYFEAGSNTTIYNHADARFIVVGDDIPPDDGAQDADWISLLSGTDGTYWDFNKLANAVAIMKYVYVQDSDASVNPIVIQPRVIVSNCPGWVDFVYVTLSQTRDQLNDFIGAANAVNELPTIDNTLYEPNGRIDRILVTVQAAVVKDFSGFEAEVDGYTILGYDPGDGALDHEILTSAQFWVILKEGDYLDTGATPGWRIIDNTTLIDSSTGAPIALYPSKDEEIPYDGAPPIIGYTLAVADSPRNEVFVHFSEPVVDDTAGAEITPANFATGVGGGVAAINRITPFPAPADNGMQEAVLLLVGPVTAGDITGNALNLTVNNVEDIPTPNSPLADDAADPPDTADPLVTNTHRISDIALGIIGNGIVEPVAAVGQTQPAGGAGVGIVTDFDGSDFLQVEDINIQVHRYTGEGFTPVLYWENAKVIPGSYKNSGLWLPFVDEVANSGNRPYSGLVPRPWSPGPDSIAMNLVAGDLFDHDWISDSKITSNADLDFFFRIDGTVNNRLYAARCEDDTASDWYRRIRPWTIKIRNVVTQAGGISILNNIINPNRNERTTLHYELTHGGTVNIQIFDLAGGLVEVLQRGYQDPGEYSVSWNGRNRSGNVVARGIYFIRYVGPGGIDQIRKVLVVK